MALAGVTGLLSVTIFPVTLVCSNDGGRGNNEQNMVLAFAA
jgi:hypothetical protein